MTSRSSFRSTRQSYQLRGGPETMGHLTGRELADAEKQFNRQVNRIRYRVEQAIAHLKTWRILHTDYRRPYETFAETITAIIGLKFYRKSF
ncbi:hypothetical protein C5E09_15030 [Rathayibacter iranicus]|nr:hypothetical protein C5E09_15030 [Rathayibacter iranicus]PPI68029.1 hypothetical protein C5E01_14970 [Rathayibacter iranicus]